MKKANQFLSRQGLSRRSAWGNHLFFSLLLVSVLLPSVSFSQETEPFSSGLANESTDRLVSSAPQKQNLPTTAKSLPMTTLDRSSWQSASKPSTFKAKSTPKAKNAMAANDPEMQPLALYEEHHAQAQKESGHAANRLIVSLVGVLILFGSFARWCLPPLMAKYPNFFEQLKQRYNKQKSEPLMEKSTEEASMPSEITSALGEVVQHADLLSSPGLTLLGSTMLNTQQELHLISIPGRQLLIASTPEGISVLCDLSAAPEPLPFNIPDLPKPDTVADSKQEPIIEKPFSLDSSSITPGLLDMRSNPKPISSATPPRPSLSQRTKGKSINYAQTPKMTRQPVAAGASKISPKKANLGIELLPDYDDTF